MGWYGLMNEWDGVTGVMADWRTSCAGQPTCQGPAVTVPRRLAASMVESFGRPTGRQASESVLSASPALPALSECWGAMCCCCMGRREQASERVRPIMPSAAALVLGSWLAPTGRGGSAIASTCYYCTSTAMRWLEATTTSRIRMCRSYEDGGVSSRPGHRGRHRGRASHVQGTKPPWDKGHVKPNSSMQSQAR